MPRPAHKQLQILDALQEAYERDGRLPELTDLARRFGIRYPTLREHLGALETKGHLQVAARGPGRSPEVTLLRGGRGVPLYGEIAAGLPVGEEPAAEGFLTLRGRDDHFALRVRGDSMADRIEAGDVVLLQRRAPERQGEICAVRVGDDESTLKYLGWSGPARRPTRYRLRPHNPAYPTLEVAPADLRVDGVYRGLLRGDVLHDLLVEGGAAGR
jgi:repressor LexA